MDKITLLVLVAICFIGATYGTKCSAGPGYRFPVTCPGKSNVTKTYCCEIEGSFRCCDEKEFGNQKSYRDNDDDKELVALRHKRDNFFDSEISPNYTYRASVGLGTAAIIGIILAAIFPFALCCCCCCCACCPCYHWCHPNSTNVTIVQSGGAPPSNVQNNFSLGVPIQSGMSQPSASMSVQQPPPPQYSQEDYTKPSAAGWA